MAFDAMTAYNEKKKKEEYGSKFDAATQYEKNKYYETLNTDDVNEDYINSFINDTNTFFGGMEDTYNGINWGNASAVYDTTNKTWQDLKLRGDLVGAYLYKNRNSLDQNYYNEFVRSLFNYDTNAQDILKALQGQKDFYAQFDSEDAYKSWQADEDAYNAIVESGTAQKGWEQYLQDNKTEKSNGVPAWLQALNQGFITGSDNAFNTSYNNLVYNYQHDDSYKQPQSNWTERQKTIFGDLYLQDKAKATQYAIEVNKQNSQEAENKILQSITQNAIDKPFWSTVAAIPASLTGIADYLDNLAKVNAGRELGSTGAVTPYEYSQAVIQGISNNLNEKYGTINDDVFALGGKGWGDVYSLGTSIVQSGLAYGIGGGWGSLLMLGGSAAATAMDDAVSRGANTQQALVVGTLSGFAEGLAEKIGIEKLTKLIGNKAAKNTFKEIASIVLQQSLNEGLEEGLTSIINNAIDNFVMQDKSNFNALVAEYMSQGLSESDATKKAWTKTWGDIAFDVAGGVVSGGVHTIGAVGANAAINKITPESYKTLKMYDGNIESQRALVDEALELIDKNSANFDIVQKAKTKLDNNQNLTGKELLSITQINDKALGKESKAELKDKNETKPKSTLKETQKASTKAIKVSKDENTIDEIASIKDNKVKVRLNNGEVVDIDNIQFDSEDEGLLYEAVADMDMNAATANSFIKGYYEGKNSPDLRVSNLTAEEYIRGFNEAYKYGNYGFSSTDISKEGFAATLTESQRNRAYTLGKIDKNAIVKAKQTNIDKKVETATKEKVEKRKGKVYFEGNKNTLNKRQQTSIDALNVVSEAIGVDIHVFESKTDAGGKRIGANGWYDAKDNSIHIDLHAGANGEATMLFTAAHELTHFIREWSPSKFKVFADFLLEQYGKKGISVNELVQNQIDKAARNGRIIDYDTAYEEVIADSCEAMLTDSNAIEKVAQLKSKDKTLWDKIKSFISDLIAKIKKVYEGLNPNSVEANYVREMVDAAEQLQALWTDALVDAGETYSAIGETLSNNGIMVDSNTDSASLFSVRDLLDNKQQQKVAEALAERFDVTIAEAKDWISAETSLASIILNPKYSQYLDYTADPNETAIKNNSDYPQGTVDFSNICKKRRDFTDVMNRIMRKFPNHVFKATDIAKIRTIMMDEGMEVACAICYVEDRRQLDSIVAQDFINSLELYRKGITTRPDGKEFNANQLKALQLIDGDTYTPSIYELISLEGRNSLKAKNPAMEEAWVKFNNARGMQSVRLLLNDAEYKRQILKYSPSVVKRKNDLGGLRIYSFSDMEMFHLIDIIQVITDSATVGLSIQGYTKVNEYAKAVKDTGEKLNRSLIPKGDLGYHMENGKVVLDYDNVEGIDINHPDFFDSTNNPNVGNILIGINATQIGAAMLDKFIDYIIPFHTGQSSEVLEEKGIAEWENYVDSQSEIDLSTNKKSSHQINIYTEVIQAAEKEGKPIKNKVDFVNKFLEVCKENELKPRFAEFLNVNENGDYVYTEGYHKFLVDFKMFDSNTGEYLPQKPVKPIFDNKYLTSLLKDYVKSQQVKDAKLAEAIPTVLERITNEIVKSDVKFSDRNIDENSAKIATDFVAYMDNVLKGRGTWYRSDVVDYIQNNTELNFVRRIYEKDNSVKSELATFLKSIEDVNVLNKMSWFIGGAYEDVAPRWGNNGRMVYPFRGAIRTFRNAIKNRINEIMTEKVGGTNLGVKNGEYSLYEIKEFFEKLNSNDEIGKLAEKVFATAKHLGVHIRFVNQTFSKQKVAGDAWGDMVEYKTSYFNDTAVPDQRKASTILHELIHICTVYVMNNNTGAGDVRYGSSKSLNYERIANAAQRLNRIYLEIKNDPDFAGQYGIKNAKEMVAELANENFVGLLKKKNLWQQIVDWICDLFGIKRGTSAYDNARLCLDYILDNPELSEYQSYAEEQRWNAARQGYNTFGDIRYSDRDSEGNTLSKEQKEFFKDSKVRDENGNLMVVYHGTETGGFTVFGNSRSGEGYWFADKTMAESYIDVSSIGEEDWTGGLTSLYTVYLNAKNPLVVDAKGYRAAYMPTDDIPQINGGKFEHIDNIAVYAKENGYDGLIVKNVKDYGRYTEENLGEVYDYNLPEGTVYVVFNPNQIKNTTNKNPSKNEDIRYSDRESDDILPDFNSLDAWFDSLSLEELNEIINSDTSVEDISEELNVEPKKVEIFFRRKGLGNSYIEENRTAVMKQSRIDEAIEDSGAKFSPDYARKYITRVSPRDFIDLTVSQNHIDRQVFDNEVIGDHGGTMSKYDYKKALQDSQSPYLSIDKSTGRVIGHNGRHRIRALEIAGIESVEIEVQFFDENGSLIKYDAETIKDMTISSQFDTAIETHLSTIIPLNEVHRAEIERTYGEKAHSNAGVKYQDRDTDSMSNRSLLANALESTTQNDIEKNKLAQYKEKIALINSEEAKLSEIKAKANEIRFTKGRTQAETKQMRELEFEAKQIANRINTYDRQLLSLEASKPLKAILEREKQLAFKRAKQKGREAVARQREKDALKTKELLDKARLSREKARIGRNKTEVKNKLKKVVSELRSLFKRGTKDRNIKIELQESVSKALDLADILLADEYTNEVIARHGVEIATEQETQLIKEYNDVLNTLDPLREKLNKLYDKRKELKNNNATEEEIEAVNIEIESVRNNEEYTKATRKLTELNKKLENVFIRERNKYNKAKATNIMDALIEAYESLKESKTDYIKNAYQIELTELLKSVRNNLNNVSVKDMSLEDLEAVYKAYSMIKHIIANSNKIFREGKQEDLEKRVESVQSELRKMVKERKDLPAVLDKVNGWIKTFTWNNLRPVDAFERLGVKAFEDLFWDNIEAQDTYSKDIVEAGEVITKAREKYGYKKWDLHTAKAFKTANGLTFKLTLGDIMSIYAYSFREQAYDHMTIGGFTFDTGKTYTETKHGIKYAHAKLDKTYIVSEETIDEIIDSLTDEQKAYAKELQDYLTQMGEKGNEVSRILYGIDIFSEKHYFPLQSEKDYRSSIEQALNATQTMVSLKNTGMTKQTVPHANNPIVLRSFDDVVLEHVDKMSKYHAFVIPIENMQKVFNTAGRDLNQDQISTKALIAAIFGNEATAYIEQYITDLNGGGMIGGVGNPLAKFFGTAKGVAVGMNLSVMAQQYFAIVRAMAEIDPKYFVPFLNKAIKSDVSTYEELKKYAPVTVLKEMGGFDIGSNRGAKDYIGMNNAPVDGQYVWNKIQDATMFGAAVMDRFGWTTIWLAVKKEIAATRPDLAIGSDQYFDACRKRFNEVVTRTQVYDSVNTRSGYMRSKHDSVKYLTSFMGEPTTAVGMHFTAVNNFVRALKYKDKEAFKKAKRRLAGTLVSLPIAGALTAMSKALIQAMRDDDEYKSYIEKWISHYMSNFIEDMNPMTYLPVFKDIVSIIEGWDIERPDMTLIADLVTSLKKVFSENSNVDDVINALGAVANIFGLPLKNVVKDVRGIINTIKSFIDGQKTTKEGIGIAIKEGITGKKASQYEKLYIAVKSGKNLKSIIKQYTDNGVEKSTLAAQITSHFKPLYKEMSNRERASIKGYLLNAYALLGYDRTKKSKDIDNWLK